MSLLPDKPDKTFHEGLESVRIGKCQNAFFFKIGKCQNRKVSELESVRIGTGQNRKVSKMESFRIFWSLKFPYANAPIEVSYAMVCITMVT